MEDLAAADKRGEAPKYGKPLESGNKARYRFWPLHKAQMPLFFEVAWVLLCIPATSTNNERGHSVSGRICDKLRGALKPATVERLTLSWYFFPVAIKKIADTFAAQLKVLDANKMDLADVDAMLADEPPPLDTEVSNPHPTTPATTFRPTALRRVLIDATLHPRSTPSFRSEWLPPPRRHQLISRWPR